MHQHPAGEIVIALKGTFSIQTKVLALTNLKGVFIPANVKHSLMANNASLEITLFEQPSGLPGLADQCVRREDIFIINSPKALIWQTENLQKKHSASATNPPFDGRILRCKTIITQFSCDPKLSTERLAAEVFLSPSRLSHLFKEQLGVSIPQYILWARTREAVSRYLAGETNLQSVALQAGFYDPAHFSRAFRSFFGEKPSFAYNSQSVQDFLGPGT